MAAVLAIGLMPTAAHATAPRDKGWWTATNPSVPAGVPVAAPVAPPGPPDVPAGGLLIQAGAGATPTAYAAVLYELDPGTTAGKLTLAVAPNSGTTPMSTLQVCQLLQPINHPEEGGPLSDAPPYNCSKSAKAGPSADGKTYQFDAAGLVTDNLVAVAILPTGPADRVVFSSPDDGSLSTQAGTSSDSSAAATDTGPVSSDQSAPAADTSGGLGTAASPTFSDNVPGATATEPTSVSQAPAATPARPGGQAGFFLPAAATGPEKATPILVILFLIGCVGGGVLWLYAGRQQAGALTG